MREIVGRREIMHWLSIRQAKPLGKAGRESGLAVEWAGKLGCAGPRALPILVGLLAEESDGMPSRPLSIVILLCWVYATFALFERDVLPGLLVGPPPDLHTLLKADPHTDEPVNWAIQLVGAGDLADRSVGQIRTSIHRTQDGWANLNSFAWFDSASILKGSALATNQKDRVEIRSVFAIEPSGNLEMFRAGIQLGDNGQELMILEGRVAGNNLVVQSHGSLPMLNWKQSFTYQPHSLIQNSMGPLGYMPGLHVGQRWTSRVVNPLTGTVDQVSMAVEGRRVITWDGSPVTTLELVTRKGPTILRTWVRPDGLVLRQELPFAFARLMLERLP